MEPPTKTIQGKFAKYRIWDEDKKRFYFSGETLITREKDKTVITPQAITIDYKIKEDFDIFQNITEFTGILDSSAGLRPIYTGDIIALTNATGAPAGKGVAQWITEAASFNVSIDLMNRMKMVIIGNVFENKDLLEQMQKEAPKPQLDLSGDINAALKYPKRLVN